MVCPAPVALALLFAVAFSAPTPLAAQYRADRAVAASMPDRAAAGRPLTPATLALSPVLHAVSDSVARAHSLGRHLLIGLGVGAAAGLAVGTYSRRHSSDCNDCMIPASAIPAFGAAVGAAVGTLVGWIAYLSRSSGSRADSGRLRRGKAPHGGSLTSVGTVGATGIRLCA